MSLEGTPSGEIIPKEHKKKKHKGRKGIVDTEGDPCKTSHHRKKKKTKHQEDTTDMVVDKTVVPETLDLPCEDDSEKRKRKKKKKRKVEDEDAACFVKTKKEDLAEENGEHCILSKKKKKKSKEIRQDEDNEQVTLSSENMLATECKVETSVSQSDGMQEKMKKKEKKKRKREKEDVSGCDNVNSIQEKTKKEKKKRKGEKEDISDCDESDGMQEKMKKKEKKNRKRENEDVPDCNDVKKKKKEMDVTECKDPLNVNKVDADDIDISEKKKHKKSKKKRVHECDDVAEKNEDIEKKELVANSPVSLEKNISLVEKERENSKDTSESDTSAAVRSQWQGDLFENKDRQNKFLRLLGGMKKSPENSNGKGLFPSQKGPKEKKGLFGSLASVSQQRSNVALSSSAAATLNKSLEEDYNRALNLRLGPGRGSGLGFAPDPAEGKKFHIDTKTVKSKVFDD
ncbi:lysine-rich nucleolar protein 1 [Aplysia californica]|uniref:Lysine-rich nucleolar protein 1 n=1 Tax=Aplysia californica TaxID=6500 RepID=A0ABM0JEY7_APLCA|nr:lysine-rich nucleolar protein 1 [Aplysia californica]